MLPGVADGVVGDGVAGFGPVSLRASVAVVTVAGVRYERMATPAQARASRKQSVHGSQAAPVLAGAALSWWPSRNLSTRLTSSPFRAAGLGRSWVVEESISVVYLRGPFSLVAAAAGLGSWERFRG